MNYDTLKIILTKGYDLTLNFLNHLPEGLVLKSSGLDQSGEFVKGNLRNLYLVLRQDRISIEGSIQVFAQQENLSPFTFKEVSGAIHQLGDMLNFPIEEGRVSRFDFSGNILLRHPVEAYLAHFGQKSRFKRQEQNNGIYYQTEEKILLFYDKIKEMKSKRMFIPPYFDGKNVLRYELRFMKKLSRQFKVQELQVKNLLDRSFFEELCHLWRSEYKSIEKNKSSIGSLSEIRTKRDLIKELSLMHVQQIGVDKLQGEIREMQLTGKISKKDAYEMRKFISEEATEKYPSAENDLISELNQKIKAAARFEV